MHVYPKGQDKIQVFNETGDHGQGWKLFSVAIGAHADFQVSIIAVMGESYEGDIAIDDLAFTDCELTGGATIVTPPQDTTGLVGDEIKLTCDASGDPFPTITWTDAKNATIQGKGLVRMNSMRFYFCGDNTVNNSNMTVNEESITIHHHLPQIQAESNRREITAVFWISLKLD